MPKYIIIGLGIPIILFVVLHYWSKFSGKTKNKIIWSILGILVLGFVALMSLLIF